jgi:protein ImuB
MALVPEGPPRRFRWRGMTYEIERAEGPERIAAEWWREAEERAALTRDYYLVEDLSGHRFWLFRQGLFGRETQKAHWFVHGLFA